MLLGFGTFGARVVYYHVAHRHLILLICRLCARGRVFKPVDAVADRVPIPAPSEINQELTEDAEQ